MEDVYEVFFETRLTADQYAFLYAAAESAAKNLPAGLNQDGVKDALRAFEETRKIVFSESFTQKIKDAAFKSVGE